MRPVVILVAVLCGVAGLAVGCRHAPREDWRGESAFKVVHPPAPGRTDAKPGDRDPELPQQRVVEAEPILPLRLPEYPAAALAARAGAAKVGVVVVIGADGRVASVEPSVLVYSTPGPFADEFLAAVQAAVRAWQFRPAELQQVERVEKDGAVAWRVTKRERTEAEFTMEFTFTASGRVQLPGDR